LSNDSAGTDTRSSSGLKPIAFLDRDGVLNVDIGYLYRPEDLVFTPDAEEAVRWLNEHGVTVVVVTNQSGIGRGLYSVADFEQLMGFMVLELAEAGAQIDGYYFCPHLPDSDCECRKPKPGMILDGLRDFGGDPSRSFFIGDKATDMEAAAAAGVRGVLYSGGSLLAAVREAAGFLEIA